MTDLPKLTFSKDILSLAGTITLADLLESPMTVADTVSMISNVVRHGGDYNNIKQDADYELELLLFRINQLIEPENRTALFNHLRQRRAS